MPAQKRSFSDTTNDDEESLQQHINNSKQSRREQHQQQLLLQQQQQHETRRDEQSQQSDDDDDDDEEEDEEREQGQLDEDGERSPSSSSKEKKAEKSEYVFVKLSNIRKDVQCPICLGIIKKTRTVMECLHRFCRECIDKSMRLGNNECPACRTHCASRRSLRDDPNFDALIAALYPDIAKYEEEELAFHEEEKTRNKQIQASIAQILQKQSEALVKRRSLGRDPGGGFLTRSQRNLRTSHPRRRRNSRGNEHAYEENEDEHDNNGGKDASSADEHTTEVRQRGRRKRTGIRPSVPSSSIDGQCIENDLEPSKEGKGISPGLVWNPDMLAWGRGGTRSHTRHGGNNGHSKSSKSARLSKLVEYLRSVEEKCELDIFVTLVSLDKERIADLKQPYLCGRSGVSIEHLCKYVAKQTLLPNEEVEILVVEGKINNENISTLTLPLLEIENNDALPSIDLQACTLILLERDEKLGVIAENHASTRNHLILGYRQKKTQNP